MAREAEEVRCSDAPSMLDTGVVVVALDHQSGACLCYPPDERHALRLPPEVFAALDSSAPRTTDPS